MRRVLIIFAALIVRLGAGGWAYFYFFAGGPELEVADTPSTLPDAGQNGGQTAVPEGNQAPLTETSSATQITSRLVRISPGPVVPALVVLDRPAASATSTSTQPGTGAADVEVRYIEQRSGNIYSYFVRSNRSTRISNKTLPGIAEAAWLPSGETVYVRYLSGDDLRVINTYGLAADGSGGFFLPQGLAGIAVSSTSILTLASGASGSVASRLSAGGTGSATVFTSPLTSLRAAFAGGRGYFAFTRPAAALPGYLFRVDGNGRFSSLVGPLPGLVALGNHSGTGVLVSTASGNGLRMMLVSAETGEQIALPVATIADKCVWTADDSAIYCAVPASPPGDYSYPDDWYQGAVHFSDRIWRIDVNGRFAQFVLDPPTADTGAIDAHALALDPAGTVLVFVNKNDGSLWSYQL